MITTKDWRNALRTPPAYRVVNRTLRNQTKFVSIISITGLLVLLIIYIFPKKTSFEIPAFSTHRRYNHSYPLSSPIVTTSTRTFRIGKFLPYFHPLPFNYNLKNPFYHPFTFILFESVIFYKDYLLKIGFKINIFCYHER